MIIQVRHHIERRAGANRKETGEIIVEDRKTKHTETQQTEKRRGQGSMKLRNLVSLGTRNPCSSKWKATITSSKVDKPSKLARNKN